jgi:hypothetical protein
MKHSSSLVRQVDASTRSDLLALTLSGLLAVSALWCCVLLAQETGRFASSRIGSGQTTIAEKCQTKAPSTAEKI